MTMSNFAEMSAINVNDHLSQKQGLSYLSWAWAWDCFKRLNPDASYKVWRNPATNEPYTYDETLGYMVYTSVTVNGETLDMWLPVMDGANKAMKKWDYTYTVKSGEKTVLAATMFDINTALMRCLVKNIAMFGLGLYIYEGENRPYAEVEAEEKTAAEELEKHLMAAANTSYEAFVDAWRHADSKVRENLVVLKPELLGELKAICQPIAA